MFKENDKPIINNGIRFREESFGLILFNSLAMEMFEINSIGKIILKICNGNNKVIDIIKIVKNEVGNVKNINNDILEFLNECEKYNIIKKV